MEEESRRKFYAHSPNDYNAEWELLSEHLKKVADRCRDFGKQFGFAELAQLAGLLHDIGKYQNSFQDRIRGKNVRVEHSIVGAIEALRLLQPLANMQARYFDREILAYIIAGHHSGLPNCGSNTDTADISTLKGRLKRDVEDYTFYQDEIDNVLENYSAELWISKFSNYEAKERTLAISILTRMLFSVLVDSDSLETEKFYLGKERASEYSSFNEFNDLLKSKFAEFSNSTSKINLNRDKIRKLCESKARQKRGVFSLTVPTGGGKTLSSMSFALNHLLYNGHRRIIYVIPYTAIIEQTAKVFKSIFNKQNVLEHHSNFVFDGNSDDEMKHNFATENWDAPIVLTTNVQFFESLFSSRRSNCRKLHNIANSVIIFDEAQMLPIEIIKPCLKAVDILTRNFGCSALLMSATCPDFRQYLCKGSEIIEINDDYKQHYVDFERVEAEFIGKKNNLDLIRHIDFSKKNLVVVNSRKGARELFLSLLDDTNKYHLSTLMTPLDRKATLEKIARDIKEDRPCVVVSTQLIECGVDLDFDVVYRNLAGLDSIMQAFGRCNREGKHARAKSYIFEAIGDPARGDIPIYKNLASNIIKKSDYKNILSLQNINQYFKDLFEYKAVDTDAKNLMDLFNIVKPSPESLTKSIGIFEFDFQMCDRVFEYIENISKYDIVIANDDKAKEVVEKIKNGCAGLKDFRKLSQYIVSIYSYEFEVLQKLNKVYKLCDNDKLYVLYDNDDYDFETGLKVNYLDDNILVI